MSLHLDYDSVLNETLTWSIDERAALAHALIDSLAARTARPQPAPAEPPVQRPATPESAAPILAAPVLAVAGSGKAAGPSSGGWFDETRT